MPKLIDALKFEHVRARVAYILGQMGPAAAPATDALAGLIDDSNPRVSSEAVLALAKIGPGAKAAVPLLLKGCQAPRRAKAATITPLSMPWAGSGRMPPPPSPC